MRKAELIILLIAATAAQAGVRIMDVDVYKNVNGWSPAGPPTTAYIEQSFINTADSLLWAEFFVGDSNTRSTQYTFEIVDPASNRTIFRGTKIAAGQHYEFVSCDSLKRWNSDALIKGKSYVLKITHSDGDPINFYYDSLNSYKYGHLILPGQDQGHPEEYYPTDLVCRIEGVARVNSLSIGCLVGFDRLPGDAFSLHDGK